MDMDEEKLVDVDEIKKLNPALSQFYEEEFMPPTSVLLKISNTNTKKEDKYVLWSLEVKPANPSHKKLIRAVVFDLHPTFRPSSVEVTEPPFAISRTGWGTFEVKITVHDICGDAHHFVHSLSFDKGIFSASFPVFLFFSFLFFPPSLFFSANNKHIEEINVAQPSSSPSSSPPKMRMENTPENEMHGHCGVGKGWAAPFLVTYCDQLARPEYSNVKAHEYNEDPITLREKVKVLAELIKKSKHFLAYTGAGDFLFLFYCIFLFLSLIFRDFNCIGDQ